MGKDQEKPNESEELSPDDLESVSGGAAYMKLGDIKGEVSATRQKELLTFESLSTNRTKKG